MALIDKASLLMVPSTYEAGKLYNVLPSGNRAPDSTNQNSGYDQTRADFDFDRGSNAAATRVNASGLIEKYRENLLLQSNQFDTTWPLTRITLTSGQSGYDGSNNAWELSSTATSGQSSNILQNVSLSGVQTFSLYAKAGTASWFRILGDAATDYIAFFDLSGSGAVGTTSGEIDAQIVSVGGGWFRCSITANATISRVILNMAAGNNNVFPNTGDTIYIQSAQLEKGMVASSYLDSGATTAKAGVLVDLPRINYDANGENGSLLLEPSRTNSYLYSDYLYNFNGTETFNYATSPEGVKNATLLTKTSASDQFLSLSWSGTTISASSDYTMSIFVKHNGDDVNVRYEYNNSNDWGAVAWAALFEVRASGVTASTAGNCTSDVEDYGSGWYRLKVFLTSGASITASSPANLFRVIGANGESVLVYGAQMELGSYVSSYIPCMGTSETRAADSCSVTGVSDVIGQTEGTLFVEFKAFSGANEDRQYSISDGSTSNRISIAVLSNGTQIQFVAVSGGTITMNVTKTISTLVTGTKIAFAYKANDFEVYANGVSIATDTSGAIPTSLTDVKFDRGDGGDIFIGNVNEAILFKERLSNAELAALTA